MLLEELIQTKQRERNSKERLQASRGFMNPQSNNLGAGSYGYAQRHKTDDSLVTKASGPAVTKDIQSDAYYMWTKYNVDNHMADGNPWFPRVYDIVVFKDPHGLSKFKIKMERLLNMHSCSSEELESAMEKINPEKAASVKSYLDDNDEQEQWKIESWVNHLEDAIREVLIFDGDTVDKNLIEVQNALHEVKGMDPDFFYDVRAANMLVRRTPHGIQIVITDPLGDGN